MALIRPQKACPLQGLSNSESALRSQTRGSDDKQALPWVALQLKQGQGQHRHTFCSLCFPTSCQEPPRGPVGSLLSRRAQYQVPCLQVFDCETGEMQSCMLLSRLLQSKQRTHTSQSTSSPPSGTPAAPTSVPAQTRSLPLSRSPLSSCKRVWFSRVPEPPCHFPHLRRSHFCPCYWCAPPRPCQHPSPWPCLAAQVHFAPVQAEPCQHV